jgi:hypothetical protein
MSYFRSLLNGDQERCKEVTTVLLFFSATITMANLLKHLRLSPAPNPYLLVVPAFPYLIAAICLLVAAKREHRSDYTTSAYASVATLVAAVPVLYLLR